MKKQTKLNIGFALMFGVFSIACAGKMQTQETKLDTSTQGKSQNSGSDNSEKSKFIPYTKAPVALTPIAPVYPADALEAGVEGTVVVEVFINKKGKVQEINVFRGLPGTGLNEAAVKAVKKTRFSPAENANGHIGVWLSIPIRFTVNKK